MDEHEMRLADNAIRDAGGIPRKSEKGKVTDEEIEQHLLEQIHKAVKNQVARYVGNYPKRQLIESMPHLTPLMKEIKKLAEHEYQKLKDND